MNLQQLAALCTLVDNGCNVSHAARVLGVSQPLVTRQIQSLEHRLGTQLFHRNKRRLTSLTRAGEAAVPVARRIMLDVQVIDAIGEEFSSPNQGDLTLATTHTYARHFLPKILQSFALRYPKVRIILKQGSPAENANEVATGAADLFIASEPDCSQQPDIVLFPFMRLNRVILVHAGHPLLQVSKPSLRAVASYPFVTFSAAFSARAKVLEVFDRAGLTPNIVLSATDAEVIKTYVRQGMGIAILSSLSIGLDDRDLVAIDARHLFKPSTVYIGLRRDTYLREYQMALIEMIAPELKRDLLRRKVM